MHTNYTAVSTARLKMLMEENGITQTELLKRAEKYFTHRKDGSVIRVTKSDLSQYLSGKHAPNTLKAEILAKVFDVNTEWLMGFGISRTGKPEGSLTPDQMAIIDIARTVSPERAKTIRSILEAMAKEDQLLSSLDSEKG